MWHVSVNEKLAEGVNAELRDVLEPLLQRNRILNELTYVLTIEDPYRFPKIRAVGCFLGLRGPWKEAEPERNPPCRIPVQTSLALTLGHRMPIPFVSRRGRILGMGKQNPVLVLASREAPEFAMLNGLPHRMHGVCRLCEGGEECNRDFAMVGNGGVAALVVGGVR
jgi:hypothetical protein